MFWIFATMLIGVAALFAARPFLRNSNVREESDIRAQLYRSNLDEIESDEAQGFTSSSEAEALRVEAQRRLLAASNQQPEREREMPLSQTTAAVVIAGLVIAGGVSLYALEGQPALPSAPATKHQVVASNAAPAASNANASQVGDVDSMVTQLAARLENDPDNADGWRMLGWSYFNLQRFRESADAYARAVALAPDNAGYQAAYGEALVMAAAGFVTDDALAAFEKTISLQPDNPRARFFKGLALDQAGDPEGALSIWIDMVNGAPPGAEWVPDLRKRIVERSSEVGVDISGRLTDAPPAQQEKRGPTVADIQAAMEMPSNDRNAMIEGMVASLAARLQENPNDPDGWIRLIRSKMVLGRPDEAQSHLNSAISAFANQPETKARIIAEAKNLGVPLQ